MIGYGPLGFSGFMWTLLSIGLLLLVWLWVIKLAKEVLGKRK